MGWNLNDSTTSLLPNISSYSSTMIALHQNVSNSQNTLTLLRLRWRIFPQDVCTGQMCMADAGTTHETFILPAPPVGGLPFSQDWLDRITLIRDRTIPITLPSGKNILAEAIFKFIIGYTNVGAMQLQWGRDSRVCLFVTSNTKI